MLHLLNFLLIQKKTEISKLFLWIFISEGFSIWVILLDTLFTEINFSLSALSTVSFIIFGICDFSVFSMIIFFFVELIDVLTYSFTFFLDFSTLSTVSFFYFVEIIDAPYFNFIFLIENRSLIFIKIIKFWFFHNISLVSTLSNFGFYISLALLSNSGKITVDDILSSLLTPESVQSSNSSSKN